MSLTLKIKTILFFLFFLTLSNNPTFGSSEVTVTDVTNDIFVLDIYGKRFNLKNSNSIKSGDFLKTKNSAASFVLKNKSKICLSANSSLKVTSLNLIKENYQITFEFNNGNIFLKIPNNSSDRFNIIFFSYGFKKFKSDLFLSNKNELELINYGRNLDLFYRNKVKTKVLTFNYFKLSKNGNILNTNRILNNDNIKKKFLAGCVNSVSKIQNKNSSSKPQYGCITQDGKLICGNRYK